MTFDDSIEAIPEELSSLVGLGSVCHVAKRATNVCGGVKGDHHGHHDTLDDLHAGAQPA